MAYQYDVFLSYRRKYPADEWVHQIFLPFFRSYLEEELSTEASIFVDQVDIRGGADWPLRIRQALTRSKIIVPIFMPSYFGSEWCMKELVTMQYREQQLGFRTQNNPSSLVVPVNIGKSHLYDDHIKGIEMLDCTDYYRVGEGMKKTSLYVELQGELLEWVSDVATAIQDVPQWHADWEHESWVEEPCRNIKLINPPTIIKPPAL